MFAGDSDTEFFENRIRPVLAEHCHECHSAGTKVRGGLALDSRADLLKGGDSGPAIVPGQPDDSLLIAAVRHRDPDLAMPAKQPKLADNVIADLAEWVRSGAAWPGSVTNTPARSSFDLAARKQALPWIWQSPKRQEIPSPAGIAPTAGEIDRFVWAKLAEHGIEPAPTAEDGTWFRRAYFVITGLPPSPEAVRAFVADTTPDKRERWVDGLLASPHYGERWARHWMDLVRYAESRGHESDFAIPNAWQYRDYLVRAFNTDLPYDRFVTEHIAGDLVKEPRLDPATGANESVLGTGWVFLGEEVHSPVDIRQDECERVDNKVDVLSKTFLGLTVACARCHDHKFDAITQADYYALSGFVLGSHYRQARFETEVQHRQAARELAELRTNYRADLSVAAAAGLEPGLSDFASRLLAAQGVFAGRDPAEAVATPSFPVVEIRAWTNELELALRQSAHPLHLLAKVTRDTGAQELDPDAFRARLGAAVPPAIEPRPSQVRTIASFRDGARLRTDGPVFGERAGSAGDILPGTSPTNPVARVLPYGAASRDPFWNRLGVTPGNESESGSFQATLHAGRTLYTPTVRLESGRLHYLIRGRARVYAAVDSHIMLAGPLHGNLVATFDGGSEPSWVSHDLGAYAGHRVHVEFAPDGDHPLDVLEVIECPDKPRPGWANLASWRPRSVPASFREWAESLQADARLALRSLAAADFSSDRRLLPLADWLVRNRALVLGQRPGNPALPPPVAQAAARTAEFFRAQDALSARIRWHSRTAVAWMDGTGVDEHVLIRGKPTRPGDRVPRALPTALGGPPVLQLESSGRRQLAEQLVAPSNPLVSRVLVNRVWQQVFGRGIVATPDNFGFLGERPTHPELLDHLAWQFVAVDRWSIKRLIKRLVLTETFARSSRAATGRAAEIDPNNTLLHRMPVRRLEAEAIRDAILAVSGRLDPRLGGPPVPVHLTEFIIGRGRPERSGPLDGDGRRSLYTAVPRNFLPTMMVAFDYPTPFSTVGRRNVTNVPGQPLTLMNDPFVHDQARFWAGRVLRTLPGATDATRARWMFETAFARPPSEAELRACLEALDEVRTLHASAGELEPWVDLAHALFNANEFVYLN